MTLKAVKSKAHGVFVLFLFFWSLVCTTLSVVRKLPRKRTRKVSASTNTCRPQRAAQRHRGRGRRRGERSCVKSTADVQVPTWGPRAPAKLQGLPEAGEGELGKGSESQGQADPGGASDGGPLQSLPLTPRVLGSRPRGREKEVAEDRNLPKPAQHQQGLAPTHTHTHTPHTCHTCHSLHSSWLESSNSVTAL